MILLWHCKTRANLSPKFRSLRKKKVFIVLSNKLFGFSSKLDHFHFFCCCCRVKFYSSRLRRTPTILNIENGSSYYYKFLVYSRIILHSQFIVQILNRQVTIKNVFFLTESGVYIYNSGSSTSHLSERLWYFIFQLITLRRTCYHIQIRDFHPTSPFLFSTNWKRVTCLGVSGFVPIGLSVFNIQ